MADHLNEEEQLETIKRWWDENGRSIIIGVVVAVVGYFGWQGWQSQQQQAKEAASQLFEDLLETAAVSPTETMTDDERQQVESLAEQLKSDYSDSLYASNAAMLLARLAVQQNELDKAAKQLEWVLAENTDEAISLTARLRLAQVQYGQGNFDQALATLDAAEPKTFSAAYDELRGDILADQGKQAQASAAYQSALDNLLSEQSNRRNIIEMKLQDIRPAVDMTASEPGAES